MWLLRFLDPDRFLTSLVYLRSSNRIDSPPKISAISLAVREYGVAKELVKASKFITCALIPPPKAQVLAYLGIATAPGEKPAPIPNEPLKRRGEIDVCATHLMI